MVFQGSVMAVRDVLPISLAEKVMDKSKHCVLCGEGAIKFAKENGLTTTDIRGQDNFDAAITPTCDTVTAIAMDHCGHFACATSTGK